MDAEIGGQGGRSVGTGYAALDRLGARRWLLRQPDGAGAAIEVQVTFPAHYSEEGSQRVAEFVLHGLSRGVGAPVAPELEHLDRADLIREVVRLRDQLHQAGMSTGDP